MAGDWIKMRSNLWDDPRVSMLVDLTDTSEAAVVGALYWLWATADQHSDDGLMVGLTLKAINRKTGINGFGEALVSIGWIADSPDGILIVRFEEHNGETAKARSQTARRVAKHSANAKLTPTALVNENDGVSDALARVREEKEKDLKAKQQVASTLQPSTPDAPAENATRTGVLCKQLRVLGYDAAPHLGAWAELLPNFSDTEIIEVAKATRDKKPGERLHLNYLVPILKDRVIPNARASPAARGSSRKSRIDNYAAEAASARGEHGQQHSTGGTERDITGESVRVA